MLDRIEFLIGESFSALRRNTWMTFAAVTTVCMAIFILGGLGLAFFSFRNVVVGLGQRAEMKVLLLDTLPDRDASLLQGQILAIPGVKSATFVPRSEGLKQLLKENPDIDVEGLQIDNPLPNAYVVRVTELKDFDTVADQVGKIKGVEPRGVKYPADEKNFLMDTVKVLQWLGMALGAIMLATSGILIYNSIRMSVVARRREIRIMQLVGATRFMVWAPMLLEGIVQGAIGGALATLILWGAHNVVQEAVIKGLSALGRPGVFPFSLAFTVLVGAGALYGFVCSLIAVREPLQVKRSLAT